MSFHSILFETPEKEEVQDFNRPPGFLSDLNLDQVFQEVLEGKEEYKLSSFFYYNTQNISTINYRLEIMKELENTDILDSLIAFSHEMQKVREFSGFSANVHNRYQREKWLLDTINLYCNAALNLSAAFNSLEVNSKGLSSFRHWLTEYVHSDAFKQLYARTSDLHKELSSIRYSIQIERGKITVVKDEGENDYCAAFVATFKDMNEAVFDYKISFFTDLEMCDLETRILDIVRKMNMESFNRLEGYCREQTGFLHPVLMRFDREIQFYISYLKYIEKLRKKGCTFAYPRVSNTKNLDIVAGYDLALAYKLAGSSAGIIANDYSLEAEERIYILTGPNQGGKTTFARAFGQILHLASIGCPVPCQKADLPLFDRLYTHFSAEENLSTNAGRLKEELVRLKQIVEEATTTGIIIINELFATTTSLDAYTMGKIILEHFLNLDCICLYVTHIYELARISTKTVSLVAAVEPDNLKTRTYKVVRKPADGQAHANSIVEKHKLTYSQVKERIKG